MEDTSHTLFLYQHKWGNFIQFVTEKRKLTKLLSFLSDIAICACTIFKYYEARQLFKGRLLL